jgi:hypothetical protein
MTAAFARRLSPTVVELLPPAEVDKQAVACMARDVASLGYARIWVMDISQVENLDPDSLPWVEKTLAHSKPMRLVMVVPDEMTRMAIDGWSDNSPVPVTVCETRAEAMGIAGIVG